MGGLFSSSEPQVNHETQRNYLYEQRQNKLRKEEEYSRRQYQNRNDPYDFSELNRITDDYYRKQHENEQIRKRQERKRLEHIKSLLISKVPFNKNILNIPEFYLLPNQSTYVNLPVSRNNHEFMTIEQRFRKTSKPFMKITRIESIINPYLKSLYELKKKLQKRQGHIVSERLLFHGTLLQYLPEISKQNFNWRLRGTSKGTKYGQGVSFSPFAFYASHYCDKNSVEKVIILSRVLVTKEHVGDTFTRIPMDGFDTTRNFKGDVIVKYDDDTFYPEYAIYFHINENR